ncbi:hypothetical protein [Mesorhizobium qingshengii]|uniref:Uncharacterized protein n=1 Tax=Mesorhizobium qingshengii TaxID=1165689 RepID=A0A1G5Z3P7_9HYPH|nr:hypothetical protein [Mesorhizobium qingshengii]SDA89043.1 hypothetical protein SAMN02927914_04108 [Mesorhizobium qingshengii]
MLENQISVVRRGVSKASRGQTEKADKRPVPGGAPLTVDRTPPRYRLPVPRMMSRGTGSD